ncbi:uncharacterized protein LOC109812549 [Cajanus cajan]|uniref:Pectinesterase inhibitor domain-containing protein n=1 Tax=Cajanus cajan TaxID=3821 RepID=A0A151S715_CAJCA|nr:uncharacterized protein LOC109812549 [Cajanus cajan]KYP50584.1 hypothetical protein KK1_027641 [Cajanus cajan]
MNSSAACFLLVTLGLVLISQFPVATHARGHHDSLVGEICMQTLENKDNCMQLLKAADPSIVHAKDFSELSKAVLTLALNKGTEGQAFLKELAKVQNSPAITECANFFYDGVVGSFRSALGEFKEDPQTANYDSKVAIDGPDGCNRALASEKIYNPAIDALNKEIMLLSTIAFQATNKLSS